MVEAIRSSAPCSARSLHVRWSARNSQQFVAWTAAAFRCDPIDHFVGVHDVARLAVDAVGGIDLQTKSPVSGRSHFIHGSRTEELTGFPYSVRASRMANIGVRTTSGRLIFIVIGSGVINIVSLSKVSLRSNQAAPAPVDCRRNTALIAACVCGRAGSYNDSSDHAAPVPSEGPYESFLRQIHGRSSDGNYAPSKVRLSPSSSRPVLQSA